MPCFVIGIQLSALLLAILLHAANCEQPKPIVPSAWAEAGRMLAGPEISERTHGLEQQAIDGLRTNLEGAVHRFGEKALAKVRELKEAMPKKFQALVEKALQLFSEPSAGEKEQWDKLIKSVEATNLKPEEKRVFYEKMAAATIQQTN